MPKTVKNKWPEWINVQRDDRTIKTSFNINNTRWKRLQVDQELSSEDEIVDQFTLKNSQSSFTLEGTQNWTNYQVTIVNNYYRQEIEEENEYIRMQDLSATLNLEIPKNFIIENRVYRLPTNSRSGSSILMMKKSKWSTFYQRLRNWLSRIIK